MCGVRASLVKHQSVRASVQHFLREKLTHANSLLLLYLFCFFSFLYTYLLSLNHHKIHIQRGKWKTQNETKRFNKLNGNVRRRHRDSCIPVAVYLVGEFCAVATPTGAYLCMVFLCWEIHSSSCGSTSVCVCSVNSRVVRFFEFLKINVGHRH